MKVTCKDCGALKDAGQMECDCLVNARAKLRDQRRTTRRLVWACLALMGGKGWAQNYECEHGVAVGDDCEEDGACSLWPVRRVEHTLSLYEKKLCAEPEWQGLAACPDRPPEIAIWLDAAGNIVATAGLAAPQPRQIVGHYLGVPIAETP